MSERSWNAGFDWGELVSASGFSFQVGGFYLWA